MISIEDNIGLVYTVANKFKHNKLLEHDDIVGFGMVGLVEAAKRFDDSKGVKFSTYAYITIYGNIKRAFRDCSGRVASREEKCDFCSVDKLPVPMSKFIVNNQESSNELEMEFRDEIFTDFTDDLISEVIVKEALDKLDDKLIKTYKMYYELDMSQEEISKYFSVTQTAISKRLYKIKNHLKGELLCG